MPCQNCCLNQQQADLFFRSEAKQSYTCVEPPTTSALTCQSPYGAVGIGPTHCGSLAAFQAENGNYLELAKHQDGTSPIVGGMTQSIVDNGATLYPSPATERMELTYTTNQSQSSTDSSYACTGNARAPKNGKDLRSENTSVVSDQSRRHTEDVAAIPNSVRLSQPPGCDAHFPRRFLTNAFPRVAETQNSKSPRATSISGAKG